DNRHVGFTPATILEHPVGNPRSPLYEKWFIIQPSAAFRIAFTEGNELTAPGEAVVNRGDARAVGGIVVILAGAQADCISGDAQFECETEIGVCGDEISRRNAKQVHPAEPEFVR